MTVVRKEAVGQALVYCTTMCTRAVASAWMSWNFKLQYLLSFPTVWLGRVVAAVDSLIFVDSFSGMY
jgi:hypothetical protein